MDLKYANYLAFNAYIFILLFSRTVSQDGDYNVIKSLRENLLKNQNYDIYARPVKDHNTVTVVKSMMTVVRFIDLDYTGRLRTLAIIQLRWTDEHLQWDPKQYDGLNALVFGVNEVWKPDLRLIIPYNKANDKPFGTHAVYVNSSGYVEWDTLAYLETRCLTYLNQYPYDKIRCGIFFSTKLYNVNQVNYTTVENNTFLNKFGPYFDMPQWDIYYNESVIEAYPWDETKEYSLLYVLVSFKRQIGLYYNMVQIPYYTAFALSLIMFALPPNSKQRYKLGFIIILMMTAIIISIGYEFKNSTLTGAPKSLQNICVTLMTICVTLFMSTLIARFVSKWSEQLPPQPYITIAYILDNKIVKLIASGYFPIEQLELEFKSDFKDLNAKKEKETVSQQQWITIAMIIDKLLFFSYLLAILICHA